MIKLFRKLAKLITKFRGIDVLLVGVIFFVIIGISAREVYIQRAHQSVPSPIATTVVDGLKIEGNNQLLNHEQENDLTPEKVLVAINYARERNGQHMLLPDSLTSTVAEDLALQFEDSIDSSSFKLETLTIEKILLKHGLSSIPWGLNFEKRVTDIDFVTSEWAQKKTTVENLFSENANKVGVATGTDVFGDKFVVAIFINDSNVQQQISASDPIVNCSFPHTGVLPMPQSKCDQMTDCEIEPGKWQAVWVSDCEALYKREIAAAEKKKEIIQEQVSELEKVATVPCSLSYGTYNVSPKYCATAKKNDEDYVAWKKSLNDSYQSGSYSLSDSLSKIEAAGSVNFDPQPYKSNNALLDDLKRVYDENKSSDSQTDVYIECGFGHGC